VLIPADENGMVWIGLKHWFGSSDLHPTKTFFFVIKMTLTRTQVSKDKEK